MIGILIRCIDWGSGEDKARPLLVALGNGEMKEEIMANLRNRRQPIEKFKRIGISHDLPPKEREELKQGNKIFP